MSNYFSIIEAPKEQHSGSFQPSSNSARNLSSKKSKSTLESPHIEIQRINSELPEDIVEDIFSRLSVKDLKNCIRVRKSWCKMILSPKFSELYFEKSVSDSTNMVSFIVQDESAFEDPTEYDLFLVQCESSNGRLSGSSVVLPLRTKLMEMDIEYVLAGSCQGLLCLTEPLFGDPVYIYNPLTREYMTLPLTTAEFNFDIVSGFGYDTTASVCKVIRMYCEFVEDLNGDVTSNLVAEVCELGSKNWRNIGYVPYRPSADCPGVFLNGCIFWLCEPEFCNNETCGIVCFNVSTEQFRLLSLPPGYRRDVLLIEENDRKFELISIQGRLYFYDESRDGFVVWMLNETTEVQPWTEVRELNELFHEVDVLNSIQELPHMFKYVDHVTSLISYKAANKDPKGKLACYDRAGTWSEDLCVHRHSDSLSKTIPWVMDEEVFTAKEPLATGENALLQSQVQCLTPYNQLSYYHETHDNKHLQFSFVQN